MTTMTWLEFKEQFLRYFYPASMRDNYRWKLLHISKGDQSVAEYTHEFLRLGHHVLEVIQDNKRVVELFVTGLVQSTSVSGLKVGGWTVLLRRLDG